MCILLTGFYHNVNLYSQFLTYLIAPPVLIIAIWIVKYVRCIKNSKHNQEIVAQHINATLLVLFLCAPIVSAVTFKLFVSSLPGAFKGK